MKNAFKIALIAAITLTSSLARANDADFSLKSKSEEEKTISFKINEANDFSLTIISDNSEIVFEQKFHASASSVKTYDLNQLPNGIYTMLVESGSTLEQYHVTIADKKAVFSAPKVSEIYKPELTKGDDDVITLNFVQPKAGDIEVKVYNESNDELYSEVFKDREKLRKKFNVSRADGKDLTFVVNYGDQTFIKTIESR